jgi:WD40 repeat protein
MIEVNKVHAFTGHSGAVYSLEKSNDEALFYSGSSDKYLAQWNLEKLIPEKFAAQFPSIVYSICLIAEQNVLLVGTSAGSIHVVDLLKKEEIKILQHHTDAVFNIKYNIQEQVFYSVGADGNFAVCSLASLSLIKIKKLCNAKVRGIDFSIASNELAIASSDCYIRIFDLKTLDLKKEFIAHQLAANCLRYSPDGLYLLSGGRDAHLNLWNATMNYSSLKSIPAHNFAIYDIVYSPDKRMFATASRDKTIKIWDASTFELLVRINKENYDGHVNSVNKLLWSDYKNQLISCGDDRSILVWDIKLT